MVCELFGGREADHAGDSLGCVEAAKEISELLAIERGRIDLILERDQRAADRNEMFVTLGVIIVEELIEELTTLVGVCCIHQLAFSKEPTTSANCRGSKGFVK